MIGNNIEQITEEVQKIIKEIGANEIKDMGKIMAILKSRFTGEIDMSKAGGIVKEYFKL